MLRRALSISRHSRYLRRNFRGIATGSVSAFLVQGPRRPFPKNARVSDLMEQQANATPALPAVAYGDKVLSFEQLADRVQCVANSLVQAGVTAGMHVGALFSRSEMTVVVMAALFKVGAVYVPLDESYPLSRIASMISGGAVSIILADEANVDKIPGEYGGRVLLLTDLRPALATAASQISGRGEDAAYVVFTSGSTGPPKAITLNHTSLVTSITGVNEDDVAFLRGVRTWVCAAATSFTVSLLEIWGAVCSGRLAYITPTMKLDPDWYTGTAKLLERQSAEGGAALQCVPLIWKGLLANGWKGHANSVGLSLGEQMPLDLAWTLLGMPGRVYNGYGSSEANYSTFWELSPENVKAYPRVPIGKLSPNLEAFIVDPTTRQPVKPQTRGMSAVVDGELWIGGPAIAQGYLGNATMTSSRFVDAPSGHSGTGGKYFATGDMVRLDGEGVLTHMGRVDDQINLGGLRIEPGEVENAVIHAARARGIPTDKVVVVARGLELCACISPPISQEACLQLQKDVIATLPPYHVPTLWLSLVAMPTTPNRKVDKKVLRKWSLGDFWFLPDVPDRFPPEMPAE